MKRIINHWTGGTYKVSALDKKHYHVIIDGDGKWVKGDYTIEANEVTSDNDYAAHTLNCNTGSIGISCAAMAGAKEKKTNGSYPLKEEQWEEMVRQNARFCIKYSIPVTAKTVLTHAEVEKNLGIKQRGKWDIAVLPFDESIVGAAAVGDKLRNDVLDEIRIQRRTARNKEVMTVKSKPVLKHRRVQTLGIASLGSTGIIGAFTSWEWQAIAVMCGFFFIIFMIALFMWREEIRAGLFGPEEKE
jgi:hypothetical protein